MTKPKARYSKKNIGEAVSRLARSWTLFLAGSHPAEVDQVAPAETRNLRVDGAMLTLSMVINGVIWSAALLSAGKPWWIALPISGLICFIIGLFDRQFLSASIGMDGEELAKHRQEVGFYPINSRRKLVLTTARILLSFASMWAAVLLLRVSLFSADIDAHLADSYRAENEVARDVATQLVDRQIADLRSRFQQAQEEREVIFAQQRSAEARTDTSGIDDEIASLRAEVAQTRAELQELAQERAEHLRGATAEDSGVRERSNDTGVPGQGTRWAFHQQRAEDIRNQMNLKFRLMQTAEARIEELQSSRQRQIEMGTATGARESEVLAPRLEEAQQRVEELAGELRQLEGDRPSAIDSLMTRDPNHTPMRNGLLVRVEALNEIAASSWSAWAMSFAITLVCSVLELAVVWYRVVLGTPHPVGYLRVQHNLRSMALVSSWKLSADEAVQDLDPRNDNEGNDQRRSA